MQRLTCLIVAAATTAASSATIINSSAAADTIDLGTFANIGQGEIEYTGSFETYINSTQQGDNGEHTVVSIDIAAILNSLGGVGIESISIIDTGNNIYNGAPGADIDLFRINGIDPDAYNVLYDGPTSVHNDETETELRGRMNTLNWGSGNGQLSGGTYLSLGQEGVITAIFQAQSGGGNGNGNTGGGDSDPFGDNGGGLGSGGLGGGGNGGAGGMGIDGSNLWIEIAEAGNMERYQVVIETISIPAPGAIAILGAAGLIARRRRKR